MCYLQEQKDLIFLVNSTFNYYNTYITKRTLKIDPLLCFHHVVLPDKSFNTAMDTLICWFKIHECVHNGEVTSLAKLSLASA